jgi:non-ribosomal peptide synthetase component F
MVGFVAENLVVRANLSEDPTFSELLSRVRSSVLDVYDNLAWRSLFATDPALEQIGLSPICFNMQPPTFEARISHPSASFSPMPALTRRLMVHCLGAILYVFEEGQGLHFDLVHNLALFDVPWAERFMGRLEALLLSVADDPNLRLSELR